MGKKQQTIDKKKFMKTIFWAAVLVLVLFFGRKLLPEDEMGGEMEVRVYMGKMKATYLEARV